MKRRSEQLRAFGRELKRLRENAKLTQKVVAFQLKLGDATAVSKIESGERAIEAEEVLILSRLYGVQIERIFGDVGNRREPTAQPLDEILDI